MRSIDRSIVCIAVIRKGGIADLCFAMLDARALRKGNVRARLIKNGEDPVVREENNVPDT